MLDKIVLSSNRKVATLVFTNKHPITISSDVDVVPLLLLFLGHPQARLAQYIDKSIVVELRRDTSDEITIKIPLKDVA